MRSNYSLYLKTFFKQHKVLAQEVPTTLKNTCSGLPQSQELTCYKALLHSFECEITNLEQTKVYTLHC